jgi:predicted phosphodiesterase
MAGGHTHEQMLRCFDGGTIINPGSIGLPFEGGTNSKPDRRPPHAEYAIVAWDAGSVSVELKQVPFDVGSLVRMILDSGMPRAESWAAEWQRD